MDCERVVAELFEHEEGEGLPPAIHVRRHLEACLRCRAVVGRLGYARQILRSLPPSQAAPHFFDRLHSRIELLEARRRRRERTRIAVGAVATAAVLAIVVFAATTRLERFAGEETPGLDARGLPWTRANPPPGALITAAVLSGMDVSSRTAFLLPLADDVEVSSARPDVGVDTREPLVYATPSWTFAAAPVSFRFASGWENTGGGFPFPIR